MLDRNLDIFTIKQDFLQLPVNKQNTSSPRKFSAWARTGNKRKKRVVCSKITCNILKSLRFSNYKVICQRHWSCGKFDYETSPILLHWSWERNRYCKTSRSAFMAENRHRLSPSPTQQCISLLLDYSHAWVIFVVNTAKCRVLNLSYCFGWILWKTNWQPDVSRLVVLTPFKHFILLHILT